MEKIEHTRKTILLVGDDAETRRGLKRLLERRGYQVLALSDEETAMRLAEGERPDLILLEIGLSQNETLAAGRRIHQHARLNDSSVIAVISPATDITTDYIRIAANEYVTMMDGFEQLEHLLNDVLPLN